MAKNHFLPAKDTKKAPKMIFSRLSRAPFFHVCSTVNFGQAGV
jgi:hypothetical protein